MEILNSPDRSRNETPTGDDAAASFARKLPGVEEMWQAFMQRDANYDGVFFVAVKTTRIFCRPTCAARKPNRENVEYFAAVDSAMYAGYRACKRCKPMDVKGAKPPLVERLVQWIERDPSARIRERDLIEEGIDPSTARRQFQRYYGMSFQAYARARRMGAALASVRNVSTEAHKGSREKRVNARRDLAQQTIGGSVLDQQLEAGFESAGGYREAFAKLFGELPSKAAKVLLMMSRWVETPLGPMLVIANDDGIFILDFVNRRGLEREITRLRAHTKAVIVPGAHRFLDDAERELAEFFAGKRKRFTLKLATRGTDFQRKVWDALLAIPIGETRSYAALAVEIGQPKAVRAVARANGDNYRGIVIPCHRVIGSDGSLTGYGGGLPRKQWLLDFEKECAR